MNSPLRRGTRLGIIGAIAAVFAAGLALPAFGQTSADSSAPVENADSASAVPNQYIVVFKDGTARGDKNAARDDAKKNGASVRYEYARAVDGFAATLTPPALDKLRKNKHVAYIEADQTVSASDVQTPVTWGLDRIDQRNLPLTNSYTHNATGAGVKAYIIDTGIRLSHTDFVGRAISGFDAVDGGSADDCNGHGTHVAGTVGGTTYGAAKAVQLVAVRVLGCNGSGTTSGVVAGIDWVTSNHLAGQPAVANMSLGGGASTSLDTAVNNSIADGVSYSIAAGNSNANACNYSPARAAAAITVGATTSSDARASYSNYGTCVDLFAPGSSITSDWLTNDTSTNTISGTSMATPHSAGAAALYLQANPTATPQQVRDQLVNTATPGLVTNAGAGSPNRLLYTLGGTPPSPPGPQPGPCDAYPEKSTGTLSSGGSTYLPSSSGTSVSAGTLRGCVDGPDGADFDLYLYKRVKNRWQQVASSTSGNPDEVITYSAAAGTYRWKVVSYSGSGAYTFGMQRP